jgi:hypothetical protein
MLCVQYIMVYNELILIDEMLYVMSISLLFMWLVSSKVETISHVA